MSSKTLTSSDFADIFLNDRPLLDVRAPIEFGQGAFPTAINLPLLTDSEREAVGICYAQNGQQAAVALGEQLVNGKVRNERMQGWIEFARTNPHGALYCFRGGLRSQTVQGWLSDAGIDLPLVEGGFKALRQFLMQSLSASLDSIKFVLVAGRTGSGKTELLQSLSPHIDLEALANHRGSTFGGMATAQPSQIDFENTLFIQLLKHKNQQERLSAVVPVYLEDESRHIGKSFLPESLYNKMQNSPLIVLEDTLQNRAKRICDHYILNNASEYLKLYPSDGFERFKQSLLAALERLSSKLGMERYKKIQAVLAEALHKQQEHGEVDGHLEWIELLLTDYYDPMYDFGIKRRKGNHPSM